MLMNPDITTLRRDPAAHPASGAMSPAPGKVVVADDHPIVREGLRAVVATLPEFELTATAASGAEAVNYAADPPDVVVMDLHMDDLDGVAATRQILAAHPRAAVFVLTMYEHDDMLVAALSAQDTSSRAPATPTSRGRCGRSRRARPCSAAGSPSRSSAGSPAGARPPSRSPS